MRVCVCRLLDVRVPEHVRDDLDRGAGRNVECGERVALIPRAGLAPLHRHGTLAARHRPQRHRHVGIPAQSGH
jgi:hypothetical protein